MYRDCNACMNDYVDKKPEDYCKFKNCKLTRAYIPHQPFGKLFPINEALKKGTLFCNLSVPYPDNSYCK